MKRIGVLAGLCLAALMTRCALPLGDDFLTPELRGLTIGNDSSIIVDYNLQNYVPVPVEGIQGEDKPDDKEQLDF
jgi:hypothetical protein